MERDLTVLLELLDGGFHHAQKSILVAHRVNLILVLWQLRQIVNPVDKLVRSLELCFSGNIRVLLLVLGFEQLAKVVAADGDSVRRKQPNSLNGIIFAEGSLRKHGSGVNPSVGQGLLLVSLTLRFFFLHLSLLLLFLVSLLVLLLLFLCLVLLKPLLASLFLVVGLEVLHL